MLTIIVLFHPSCTGLWDCYSLKVFLAFPLIFIEPLIKIVYFIEGIAYLMPKPFNTIMSYLVNGLTINILINIIILYIIGFFIDWLVAQKKINKAN